MSNLTNIIISAYTLKERIEEFANEEQLDFELDLMLIDDIIESAEEIENEDKL